MSNPNNPNSPNNPNNPNNTNKPNKHNNLNAPFARLYSRNKRRSKRAIILSSRTMNLMNKGNAQKPNTKVANARLSRT